MSFKEDRGAAMKWLAIWEPATVGIEGEKVDVEMEGEGVGWNGEEDDEFGEEEEELDMVEEEGKEDLVANSEWEGKEGVRGHNGGGEVTVGGIGEDKIWDGGVEDTLCFGKRGPIVGGWKEDEAQAQEE